MDVEETQFSVGLISLLITKANVKTAVCHIGF